MYRLLNTFTIASTLAWLCACATDGNDVGLAATETTHRVAGIPDALRESALPCETYHASELCLGFLDRSCECIAPRRDGLGVEDLHAKEAHQVEALLGRATLEHGAERGDVSAEGS